MGYCPISEITLKAMDEEDYNGPTEEDLESEIESCAELNDRLVLMDELAEK